MFCVHLESTEEIAKGDRPMESVQLFVCVYFMLGSFCFSFLDLSFSVMVCSKNYHYCFREKEVKSQKE